MKKQWSNLMADLIPYVAEPEGEFRAPPIEDELVTLKLPSPFSFWHPSQALLGQAGKTQARAQFFCSSPPIQAG